MKIIRQATRETAIEALDGKFEPQVKLQVKPQYKISATTYVKYISWFYAELWSNNNQGSPNIKS